MMTKTRATKKRKISVKDKSQIDSIEKEIELGQKRIKELYIKQKEIERGRPFRQFRFQFPAIDIVLDEESIWGCEKDSFTVDDIIRMVKEEYVTASSLIDEWNLVDPKDNQFKITEVKESVTFSSSRGTTVVSDK